MIPIAAARKYVAYPHHCPFCDSENITAGTFDGDGGCQPVVCEDCGKEWLDLYTLTGVKEVES